jgi:hypothetical protein
MPETLKLTEAILMITAMLSMVAVFAALVVTAFIFHRSRQDFADVAELRRAIARIDTQLDESGYISDEIVNVLYDLFALVAAVKAYIELVDGGYKISEALFQQINRRVSIIEKHFAEVGLFSQDEERRKSVQSSLASMYGDNDTLKIMEDISAGKVGHKDVNIRNAVQMLKARLRSNIIFVDSESWTGRPSGGSF